MITIAIVVHIPEENKSMAIPDCSNLHELGTHPSKSLQRLAFSHIFFQKIFGYIELVFRGELTHKQAQDHIKSFAELYHANLLEFDVDKDDKISVDVFEVMSEDEFGDKYSVFFQLISAEIFKLFASGAMSHGEGEVELGLLPSYMNPHIPTKA